MHSNTAAFDMPKYCMLGNTFVIYLKFRNASRTARNYKHYLPFLAMLLWEGLKVIIYMAGTLYRGRVSLTIRFPPTTISVGAVSTLWFQGSKVRHSII